jgi:formylmethanofuran dehydrogenase subunit E
MMARILLLIILIVLLYVIGKRFMAFLNAKEQQNHTATKVKDENIVQCQLCGTHIPESESTLLDEKIVCKQQPCKH